MTDWLELAARLAEQLAVFSAGAVLIIAEADGPGYAQFRQFEDRLYAELSGDHWLDPDRRAGDSGARRLLEAGWQPPTGEHNDNWWVEWTWPLAPGRYRELAAMVLVGLRDVLTIAAPGDLVYEAWNADVGGTLELPGLGLRSTLG